jgi:hypothetical protein
MSFFRPIMPETPSSFGAPVSTNPFKGFVVNTPTVKPVSTNPFEEFVVNTPAVNTPAVSKPAIIEPAKSTPVSLIVEEGTKDNFDQNSSRC